MSEKHDPLCPRCGSARPRGERFFAHFTAGELECPACGWVTVIRQDTAPTTWDWRTSVLRCPACSRRYILGVIAWSVLPGSHTKTLPMDQVPDPKQAAQLRKRLGGFHPDERKAHNRPEETNLVGAICTCPQHRVDHRCLIHGWWVDDEEE